MKKYFLLSIILILFCERGNASNYAFTFGCSPEGIGLGNAVTATVKDWSSVYYNIAGLGKTAECKSQKKKTNQLSISYISNNPDFYLNIQRYNSETSEPLSTNGAESLDTGALTIGAVLDLNLLVDQIPSIVSSSRIGILLGLNGDTALIKINDIDPRTHNFISYGRETQSLLAMLGLGMGILDDSIGFGIGGNIVLGGDGHIVATDLVISTENQEPFMQAKFDFETPMPPPLLLGMYVKPDKWLRFLKNINIGFTYREEIFLDVSPFKMAAIVDLGEIPLEIEAGMFDFYQPDIYVIGVSKKLGSFTFSADIERRKWSDYKLSKYLQKRFSTTIPEFKDITVPKFGLKWQYRRSVNFLFGYYHEKSFIPDSEMKGIFNFLDNDKKVSSFGLLYLLDRTGFLKGPVELSFSYQHQVLISRKIVKNLYTSENPGYTFGGKCHSLNLGINYLL